MSITAIAYSLAWICLIHLTIFAMILFFKKDNRKANGTLGLFMLILASIHVSHVLLLSNAVLRMHWLNELCFLLLFFEGPLFLQYTAYMTGERVNWKRYLWLHLLPFIPPIIFCIRFAFMDDNRIREFYTDAIIRQPPEAMFLLSLVTVQMTVYTIWSLRLLRKYNNRIKDQSYSGIMSLQWLYVLTIVLLFCSVVLVPLLLVLIRSDISVLYICMPLITMAVYLILFYKSINFPGTEYEKTLIRAQEREKISRDMHDELGAGITRIALLSEIAKGESTADPVQLDEISGNARRLADSLKEIIWGLDRGNDTFDNLLAYIREYVTGYLEDAGINGSIRFPEDIPEVSVSHELRRNVCMVIKEALNNTVRHAMAEKVELIISLEADCRRFSMYISDNGRGFERKHITTGNGLKNMRKRIELSGGHFSVTTSTGKGTALLMEHIYFS